MVGDPDLSGADAVVIVVGASYDHRKRSNNKILASTRDPALIRDMAHACRIDWTATPMAWMEWSHSAVVFLAGRHPIASYAFVSRGRTTFNVVHGQLPVVDVALLASTLRGLDPSLVERFRLDA